MEPPRTVVGIVSSADLIGLEQHSPFALRHAVLRAADEDELVQVATRLSRLFLSLLEAGLGAADIGRVLSLQLDALTSRLIDFSIWRHGPAPAAWAWLLLGSAARRELTLASDQENADGGGTARPRGWTLRTRLGGSCALCVGRGAGLDRDL